MRFRILALALCLVMLLALMPMATFAAEGTDGLVSVSASKSEVNVGDTLVLTFKVNAKTDPLGSINFTVNLPAGLEYVSDEQLHTTHGFLMGAYTPSTGVYGCAVTTAGKSGEFEILKLTVKAVTAGDHVVGVTLGNMSKVDGSTMMDFGTVDPVTVTAKAPAAVKDGSVSVSADKSSVNVGDTLVLTFKIKADTDPLGSINFTVNLPAGLEYVSDEQLHTTHGFLMGAYTPSTGVYGCAVTTAGKSGEFEILKLTVKAVTAGDHVVSVTLGNMSKVDGSTMMDFGTVAPITIQATGAAHTCQHDHYNTTETTHQSVCACGQTIGEAAGHTGGTATCNAKAKCAICGAEYGNVDKSNHVGETELRNAAAASCDKPGYTGDTYCKSCNELITKGEETPATGNHVDANGDWEHDENGHFHTCGCGTKFDEFGHTGGTATCNAKAKCATCGAEYGNVDKTNHVGETELRNAAAASCDKPGYTGDTYCKSCNELITKGEEIPATGRHVDADGAWESDGINHFHTCGCGAKFDEGKHTGGKATCMSGATCESCGLNYGELDPENHAGDIIQKELVTKEPTCSEPGKKTVTDFCDKCMTPVNEKEEEIPATGKHTGGKATCVAKATCEVCGQSYGDVNKSNHAGDTEIRDAVKETCGKPGYSGDTYCKSCNEKIADGKEIAATGDHKGGTATCMACAVCEVCGKEYGEKDRENHNWNQKWYQDEKVHWHECDDCHEGRNMKEHYDNDGDKKCDECGYIFGSVPGTGETPVVGIAVAVTFAAACGAVLVIKKRRAVY